MDWAQQRVDAQAQSANPVASDVERPFPQIHDWSQVFAFRKQTNVAEPEVSGAQYSGSFCGLDLLEHLLLESCHCWFGDALPHVMAEIEDLVTVRV